MSARTLRLATRGSALARAQAGMVARALSEASGLRVDLVVIRSSGDEGAGPDGRAPVLDDKSRFVKEIEDALLAGDADLALHSAKDLPGELPDGLRIAAVPERADPRDQLCGAGSIDELARGGTVGTASLRRRSQLLALRPDLQVAELRGNVDTRLRKLRDGDYDAIVLAAAGLARLGLDVGTPLAPETMVPAPGQGCLAVEVRTDDVDTAALAWLLDDERSHRQLIAERAVAHRLEAGCSTPLGAYARPDGDMLRLSAVVASPDGASVLRADRSGPGSQPLELGCAVADDLIAQGAGRLFDRVAT
jgi:hydroxymethylbilane synthase